MAECQRITDRRFFLCNRNRPRSAVLQQLAVLVVRVAYGPVSKELLLSFLPAASTNRAVMAPWISVSQTTGIPSSFSREFCRTRHDADLTLQCVPALDRDGIAGIFCSQILHRNLQSCYIFQLFRFDLYTHIGITVCNDFFTSLPSAFTFSSPQSVPEAESGKAEC